MIPRRPRHVTPWARRLSQGFFLALFLWLALAVRFDSKEAHPIAGLFFDLDPLIMLATLLAAHTLVSGFALALVTVAASVALGRVFCGWFCPFGTFHHIITWMWGRYRRLGAKAEARSSWQRCKYAVFIALLAMSLFGLKWVGVVDPFSLFYRGVAITVLPAAQYAVDDASTAVYQSDPHIGPVRATWVTEPVYKFMRDRVFVVGRQAFIGALPIALFLLGLALLNFWKPRFWCRYVCPLGGMLGYLARRPVLALHHNASACNHCGRCSARCPAAAQPHLHSEWLPSECFYCWNCVETCNFGALSFRFRLPVPRPAWGAFDMSRRQTVAAVGGGMAGLLMFRLTPHAQGTEYYPTLLRPPGALAERDFLQRCVQCGICMRACPTNALQPAGLDTGIEALWTPKLTPSIGGCEFNCNLCGQVCPTGAIQELTIETKQMTKIGLASFDTTRCLPYAYGRDCIICEEHCPVLTKAIYFVEQEVSLHDGSKRIVKQPRVNPDLCIGCGLCEWSCVFQDSPAIRVFSANESRNTKNQPILPDLGGGGADDGTDAYGF